MPCALSGAAGLRVTTGCTPRMVASKLKVLRPNSANANSAKNTGYVLCALDGIQIDTNMNALDTEGNPIEGLYVIGNDSGSYFANTYPNLSTGMACGRTVTFGRHVGKYLAGK